MLIDCHVHSNASPGGSMPVDELVRLASQRGLDGICITDVHQVAAGLSARRLAAEFGVLVLTGFEAETDLGHFLVFVPQPQELPPLSAWLRADELGRISLVSLSEAVRARGGILVAAHPFDRERPGFCGDRLAKLADLGGIEVVNGRCSRLANEMAEELAASLGLAGLGGSDTRAEADRLGQVATLVAGPVTCEADFINYLRQADAWPVELVEPEDHGQRQRRREKTRPDRERRGPRLRANRPEDKPVTGTGLERGTRPRRRRRGPRRDPPKS